MKMIKIFLAVLALGFSLNAVAASATAYRALTDDESVEFTDAIGKGDMKIVKKYMDSGVDVNVGYFAWPPLLMAAAKGQLNLVKYFAEKGADLNYQHPMTEWTAFFHAAYDGNKEMAQYLADKGADINIRGKGDMSVIRLLRDMGNKTEMVNFLLALGVKDDGCNNEKCF
jgi:ankyrin repeat protein